MTSGPSVSPARPAPPAAPPADWPYFSKICCSFFCRSVSSSLRRLCERSNSSSSSCVGPRRAWRRSVLVKVSSSMSLFSLVPCSRRMARPASKPMGRRTYSLPWPHTAFSRACSRNSCTMRASDLPFHRHQSGERFRPRLRLRLAAALPPPRFRSRRPSLSEPLKGPSSRRITLPKWAANSLWPRSFRSPSSRRKKSFSRQGTRP
mmetsp:Transcript_110086/g.245694  ORF Transcript_110086/g.245694 Transcript_110086/m.245694 type:complete len:205 (-) Transcript_110086:1216-1830(-)